LADSLELKPAIEQDTALHIQIEEGVETKILIEKNN